LFNTQNEAHLYIHSYSACRLCLTWHYKEKAAILFCLQVGFIILHRCRGRFVFDCSSGVTLISASHTIYVRNFGGIYSRVAYEKHHLGSLKLRPLVWVQLKQLCGVDLYNFVICIPKLWPHMCNELGEKQFRRLGVKTCINKLKCICEWELLNYWGGAKVLGS